MSRGGQNSTFTPKNRAAVLARLELGLSLVDAAEASGQRVATVRGWLVRGRREDAGPYADFARAAEEARATPRWRQRSAEAMDADEFAFVVSEAARAGSVAALWLRWEQLRAERA